MGFSTCSWQRPYGRVRGGLSAANTGLVEDFVGVSEEERGRAVERWFVVEDDVSTTAQEVDMVLAGEDED